MSQDPEKILHTLKKITLSAHDKSAMRFMLVSHIETQARIQKMAKEMSVRRESPFSFHHLVFGKRMLAGTVVLLLVASTGVSLAAEDTLPGDLLYGVKIHVTEEVRGALTVGSTAKVKWEKDRVVKRVIETETLIKKKTLTPARKIEAEAAIKEQIQKFDEVATSEKANPVGVIDATSDLAPTLKAHQEVLATLAVETPSASTDDIIKTVQEGIVVSDAQESAALDSVTAVSPDKLDVTVDQKITDTEAEIDTLSATDASTDAAPTNTPTPVSADTKSTGQVETTTPVVETTVKAGTATSTTFPPKPEDTTKILPLVTPIDSTKILLPIKGTETKTEPENPADATPKTDVSIKTSPITSSTTLAAGTSTILSTPPIDTGSATKAAVDVKAKSDNRKEVLVKARAMLTLAKEKKAKGELSEALRLTQQAYKSVLELNVGTQLSKDAAKDDAKDADAKKTSDATVDKKDQTAAAIDAKIDTSTQITAGTTTNTTPATSTTNPVDKIDPTALKTPATLPIQ